MSSRASTITKRSTEISIAEDQTTENVGAKLDFSGKAIKHYVITRFTDLIPSKRMIQANKRLMNPIPALREMNKKQWLMFTSAFLAWMWVAYDFFTISLNISNLSEEFNLPVKSITWGITLVLMVRTVGSIIFGYLGDRYGRKWPLVLNMGLVCILQLGTGFVKTYKEFLAVRALFGVLLGGVYGNAAATALDDCPNDARGFISGFLQQGYTFGYLMAVIFKRAIADNSSYGWKSTFWFGSGISFLIMIFRCLLPETDSFIKSQELVRYKKENNIQEKSFSQTAKEACREYWLIMIYLVLFAAGFNFISHSSQDMYPTLLTVQYSFSEDRSTVTNCVANIGAMFGGIIMGHASSIFGRRFIIIICCVAGGALIYPWAFTKGSAINVGAFFLQFCVQGAWGAVPIQLSELAPPQFRAFVVGLAYQLGNLASSASSTIETTIGEQFPITLKDGKKTFDYAKVMAIFVGCVFAYIIIITFLGPERRNYSFDGDDESNDEYKDKEVTVPKDKTSMV